MADDTNKAPKNDSEILELCTEAWDTPYMVDNYYMGYEGEEPEYKMTFFWQW